MADSSADTPARLDIQVLLPLVLVILAACAALAWADQRHRAALRSFERQAATLAEQAELLDLAHDAILVWDLHSGSLQFWNRGAEQLYGWPAADVLGRTPQAGLDTKFPLPLSGNKPQL